jgi:predicted Rossmann-fold nucleotide-binding protein
LGWELRELVQKFYRRAICEVVLGGCGVGVMEQVPCGSKHDKGRGDGVAGGGCAAKGAW